MKCNINHNHKVVQHSYTSFSYYYCEQCKNEIIEDPNYIYKIELKINNDLHELVKPYFLPEYFMIKEYDSRLFIIAIDRINQKPMDYDEVTDQTKRYLKPIIKNLEKENIILNFNIKK